MKIEWQSRKPKTILHGKEKTEITYFGYYNKKHTFWRGVSFHSTSFLMPLKWNAFVCIANETSERKSERDSIFDANSSPIQFNSINISQHNFTFYGWECRSISLKWRKIPRSSKKEPNNVSKIKLFIQWFYSFASYAILSLLSARLYEIEAFCLGLCLNRQN